MAQKFAKINYDEYIKLIDENTKLKEDNIQVENKEHLLKEEIVTRDNTIKELKKRVIELEENKQFKQDLIELKDKYNKLEDKINIIKFKDDISKL